MIALCILLGVPFLAAAALVVPLPARLRVWVDRGAGALVLAVALSLLWLPPDSLPLLRDRKSVV